MAYVGPVAAAACRRFCRRAVRCMDFAFDCCFSVGHKAFRILGPLLICLALCLITFVTYAFLAHALPLLDGGGLPGQCGLVGLGLFLLFNALYNYAKAALMDPGLPPEYSQAQAEHGFETEEGLLIELKQCRRCGRLKPERCHHCSICNRCVLKMDHHCPLVNNCVGFKNYRYFCLFMLYLGSACSFVVAVFLESGILFQTATRQFVEGFNADTAEYLVTSFIICVTILLHFAFWGVSTSSSS